MTRFLRTAPTRRLLATIAGVVAIVVAGTAIALAAAGSGPVPPREPLAKAVHGAMTAPKVAGISARVSFTNHLISASSLESSDPLLTGGNGRLWISNSGAMRLEIQSDNGDAQVVFNHGSFWAYDPSSKTVYSGKLPAGRSHGSSDKGHDSIPTIAQIQRVITRIAGHVNLSGAIPGDVGGRPTYTVRMSPKPAAGGLLGAVELAWDATKGVPLRFAVYARGDSSPVLELKATDVSYGPVAASTIAISPPAGAHAVPLNLPTGASKQLGSGTHKRGAKHTPHTPSTVASVARRVPFALDAPATLAGLSRHSVSALGSGKDAGALVTYGHNLSAIVVIEHRATGSSSASGSSNSAGGGQGQGQLPTVQINGVSATELQTPLGTVLRFTRAGVSYTVLGSVSAATAESAARGL